MKKLSHVNASGKAAMVNVGDKGISLRNAEASGFITLQPETIELIKKSLMKKGDVISICETAGILAAKNTATLIPLCHNLFLEHVDVKATVKKEGIEVKGSARCTGKTGVEMEALTAVSVALLTVYDMCKAVDKTMVIKDINLICKTKQAV
jgi:cyclic pyranopterin phosphate synthase